MVDAVPRPVTPHASIVDKDEDKDEEQYEIEMVNADINSMLGRLD